jgi:hypothetical protein
MGDGSILTLAANLGKDDARIEAPKGRLIFEGSDGAAEEMRFGMLSAHVTAAFLEAFA